jgi:hypothetical protein
VTTLLQADHTFPMTETEVESRLGSRTPQQGERAWAWDLSTLRVQDFLVENTWSCSRLPR